MKAAGPSHFGEHATIDGYGGGYDALNDGEIVRSCLTELCDALGMHPLMPPVVTRAPDNQLRDPGGWSGFLIISESHLAIHTFPRRQFLSADVYTCQNGLETEVAKRILRNAFDLVELECNFIRRGLKYPEHNVV